MGGQRTAPAGSTGQVQWNNAGVFGASANLTWDNVNISLGVGNTAGRPVTAAGYPFLVVGSTAAATTCGIIVACANLTTSASVIGAFAFANYAGSGGDKRCAQIASVTDPDANNAALVFQTTNGLTERMRITATGNVGIGCVPTYTLDVEVPAANLMIKYTTATNAAYGVCQNGSGNLVFGTEGS